MAHAQLYGKREVRIYDYADLHVPMMFWGRGIKPGRYETETSPIDIARSLGALLGVEAGGPDSRLLPCIESPAP